MKKTLLLLVLIICLIRFGFSQTTVYSTDFNTSQGSSFTTSGQIGSSGWYVNRSGADWGAKIDNGMLECTNDATVGVNANGWVFSYISTSSFSSPYNTTLSSNPSKITWYFNMRQIRTDPAGFNSGNYGVAFILGSTSTSPYTSGTGYAIVLGQTGTTDPIRLSRFNNGLSGTLTDIITSNTSGLTDFGNEYISIKVTYNPINNKWELFLRNDGGSSFTDPTTGSLTSQGTATDNTYTGTSLSYVGAYWQGSTSADQTAFFDNITITMESYLALSISTLSDFYYVEGNGPSTSKTYTIEGIGLSPSSGDITISCSGNYEVSTDNSTFGSSKTVSYTGGSFSTTTIYVRLKSGLNSGTYNNETVSNSGGGVPTKTVTCNGFVLKPEPSNHVTDFQSIESGISSIVVSWTGATGSIEPDGYLIKGSDVGYGSITAPVDGTAESDGGLVKNITSDAGAYEFSGLNSGSTYYFKIWPYTNSGSFIDYKTDGSIPEDYATTATTSAYQFRSKSSGNWGDLSSWEYSTDGNIWNNATFLPTSQNNVTILNGHTITLNGFKYTCKGLTINSGGKLYCNNTTMTIPQYLNVYDNLTINGEIGNGTTNDRISFNLYANSTISGSGTFNANRIRKNGGANTSFTLSMPIELRYTGNALYNNTSSTNSFSYIINQGGVLKCTNGGISLKSNDVLTIYGEVNLNGTLTNNAGNSGIVIKSSSSGTGNLIHNTQNVAATVERYVTGSASYEPYHLICSPVKDLAFSSIWQSNDYNVYWYYEPTSGDIDEGWTRILSGNLVNGRGYAVVSNYANRTFSWQGNLLVPDDFSSGMSVSYTNNGNSDADGWNLIGNPYPCGLKVSEFLSDNSGKFASGYEAVYLWDNPDGDRQRADFAIRNSSGGTAASGGSNITPDADIAVGQGFFVKIGSGTTSLTLAADQREAYSGTQFFIPDFKDPLRAWLSVEGPDNSYNEILCAFLPEATNGFDQKYDAAKLRGNPNIALYSFIHDSELQFAIQGLSLTSLINDEEVAVPVGIYAGKDGIYHFQVSKKENMDDILIEIEDKLTGERYRLSNGENVSFELTQGEHNDRFILHFLKNSLATRENKTGKPQIRYMHESLYLNNLTPENYEKLRIVNVMGQEIAVFNKNQLNNSSIEMKGLSQGYYFYFLEGKGANISGGFIVR